MKPVSLEETKGRDIKFMNDEMLYHKSKFLIVKLNKELVSLIVTQNCQVGFQL